MRIREKRKRQKRKHQMRHSPKSYIFKGSDVRLFRNSSTPWIVYCRLPLNNQCLSTSLTFPQKSSRTMLYTSKVSLLKFLIREGKQYPERWFISCWKMSMYNHCNRVTPLLCRHATPLLPIDHHLYHITCHPSPLNISTPSSCHPSPIYLYHHLLFM